jgi:DNA helicase HerA-like ATPase
MSERSLYLGREVDVRTRALGERVLLDSRDLVTHGLIVGMTGSGKTGLAVVLIEEVLRRGIPVIAVDPKGDLANLALTDAGGPDAESAWQKGLADWGLTPDDAVALRAKRDVLVLTPGSTAGVPVNVLQSLDAPGVSFDSAPEDARDAIAAVVSGLLTLVGIEADPLRSRESVLLSNLVEHAWRAGKGLTLEALVGAVSDPPFDKMGALPLETFFPAADRRKLALSLNALLASPSFEVWRQGEPLDIDRLLKAPDGRPRLSILYTAHLADGERLFVTAMLLDKLKTWVRRQSGTSDLRALLYMDEIFGYFPPHPADPPTKKPLLTLVKQARAQGLGVVLATQNPVDLDYKALANMGTWLVGKLQTDRDRERLRDGLIGAGADARAVETLLGATGPRVFLLHDVHRPKPVLLHSRWALSYLRGPLTREEITKLRGAMPAAVTAPASKAASAPPVLPPPLDHLYLPQYGGELADPHLFVKYAVRFKGQDEAIAARAYPISGTELADMLEGEPIVVDEAKLGEARAGVGYGELPSFIAGDGAKAIERVLRERLPDKLATVVYEDPLTKAASRPGESREAFLARLASAAGGGKAEKLRDQLDKKRRELAAKEQELSGRKTEKWAAIGGAILSNLGLFRGRKRTITGAGSVLSKNRMENNAEARVEGIKAEIAQLEADLATVADVDPARLVETTLVPARGGVKILRYEILWVY